MNRNETRTWRLSKAVVLGLLAFDLAACGPALEEGSSTPAEGGDSARSDSEAQSQTQQELEDSSKTWSPPPAPTGCGFMYANQGLSRGQRLYSCDGRFWLDMQFDGNLVLRQGAVTLWHSRTHGTAAVGAVMQGDGNFVIYTSEPRALWNSGTYGYSGAYLTVQNDGNMVIRTSRGGAIWHTQTGGR
ncbi:hypothetical protein D7V80_29500 [Corallococcus sp. CA054B]|uniref:hypothetical protein n=1 Tax=Corallococcus sp. CA054B TaxID=2316734 RepID=UPI000EA06619|nr:hypothetical protein [Corallococcus sp. CA054B]RKG63743.1 hypothetical protein D7V80_29500 [Corallococcus sp. CA054B]